MKDAGQSVASSRPASAVAGRSSHSSRRRGRRAHGAVTTSRDARRRPATGPGSDPRVDPVELRRPVAVDLDLVRSLVVPGVRVGHGPGQTRRRVPRPRTGRRRCGVRSAGAVGQRETAMSDLLGGTGQMERTETSGQAALGATVAASADRRRAARAGPGGGALLAWGRRRGRTSAVGGCTGGRVRGRPGGRRRSRRSRRR